MVWMISVGVIMLVMSLQDIKERRVSLWLIVLLLAVNFFVYFSYYQHCLVKFLLLGVLPGICLIISGYFLKNAIGLGDSLTVLALGVGFGLYKVLFVLFWATLFCTISFWAGMLLGKETKCRQVPFLPYLFAGYIFLILRSV